MRSLSAATMMALLVLDGGTSAERASTRRSPCGERSVAVVVEPALMGTIRVRLLRFTNDLCASGYNPVVHSAGFADPPTLRAYLRSLYEQSGRRLAGVVLIGDVPHAYQWVTLAGAGPTGAFTSEEAISFQYYADLDGVFGQSVAYVSPGGHQYSYDLHSGMVGWDIWVGVLPAYKGDVLQTTAAINRYLDKNHSYGRHSAIRRLRDCTSTARQAGCPPRWATKTWSAGWPTSP